MKNESCHNIIKRKIERSSNLRIGIDSIDVGILIDDVNILNNIPTKPAIKITENGITNYIRINNCSNGYKKIENYLCFGVNCKNLKENYFDGIRKNNFPQVMNDCLMMMVRVQKSPTEYVFKHEGLINIFSNLDDPDVTDNIRVNSLDIKIDFECEDELWYPGKELDVKSEFRDGYESHKGGCKIRNRRGSYSNNKANKSCINFYDKMQEITKKIVDDHNNNEFYNFFIKDKYISKNLKRVELTLIETNSYKEFGLLDNNQKNTLTNILNNFEKYGKDVLLKALDFFLIHGGENIVYQELSPVEKNVFDYLNKLVKDGESLESEQGFTKFFDNFLAAKKPNKNKVSEYRKALRKIYQLYFPDVKFKKN